MKKRSLMIVGLIAVFLMAIAGTASAAEFIGDEGVYRLEAGEVFEDDLYVAGEEVIIDGTVKGDLFVAAAYVEINGTVEGDLFAAGGGVKVTGTVMDDARIAAAGVDFSGIVGDDLFMAGGGQPGGFAFPMDLGNGRTVNQGLFVGSTSEIGGDLLVGGGAGQVAGNVVGDTYIGMGSVTFGAQVGGDVEIGSDLVTFTDDALIDGRLRITADSEPAVPNRLSERYEFNEIVVPEVEQPSTAWQIGTWVWRTALALVGFAVLSWLALRFVPQSIEKPASVLAEQPGRSALFGLLAALLLMFVPLASILLVALVWTFFGTGTGLVLLIALFGVLSLMWLFSPLVTGYWMGKLFGMQSLTGMLVGVAALVILMRLPFVGWLVALASFLFAFGALMVIVFGQRGGPEMAMPVEKAIPAT